MTHPFNDEQTLSIQTKYTSAFRIQLCQRSLCKNARVSACLVWALLAILTGCGTGFTGGGIPEGKSVVRGRVVAADNSQLPLVKATVTLVSTPTGEMTQTFRVLTDAQGQFSISGINTGKRPAGTSPTVSNVVVSVDTSKTPYQPQKVAFLLTADRPTTVVLAVPPTSFDLNQVGNVSIQYTATSSAGGGAANSLVPGSQLTFTALLLDHSGNPLVSATTRQPLLPNLALDGLSLDSITAGGLFTATLFAPTDNGAGGVTSAIGIGSTVSVTGSVNLPGAAPSVGTPLFVPVVASPTTVTATSGRTVPGASATSAAPR